MSPEKASQLLRNHPVIFKKAGNIYLGVEDGWFDIIHSLFSCIQFEHDNHKLSLGLAIKQNVEEEIKAAQEKVDEEYNNIPVIVQIKEKFGELRIYYESPNYEKYEPYFRFAELHSYRTCEVCGKPGHLRTDLSWVKTLCDEHHKERKESRHF